MDGFPLENQVLSKILSVSVAKEHHFRNSVEPAGRTLNMKIYNCNIVQIAILYFDLFKLATLCNLHSQ